MRPGSVKGSFAMTKMNLRRNYFSVLQLEPYNCSVRKLEKKNRNAGRSAYLAVLCIDPLLSAGNNSFLLFLLDSLQNAPRGRSYY